MAADFHSLPTDFDQLELSEWGLDWGDVSQIRDKLALTPTERLREAQDVIDFASRYSRRGRSSQDRRNSPSSEPVQVRVLNVETLIETKEFAGRPKDQNGLLYLRQLLAEIKQSAVAEGGSSDGAPHKNR